MFRTTNDAYTWTCRLNYPLPHSLSRQKRLQCLVCIFPAARPRDASKHCLHVAETISLSFKVSKPPRTFTLPLSPADSIATIKEQLATQPGAPPGEAQRLLLKGKALADGKLLKEYSVRDGDVINLMLKPGFEWNWDEKASTAKQATETTTIVQPSATRSGHGRIPSVVLCPSPSTTPQPLQEPTTPIPLTLDTTLISSTSDQMDKDAYQQKIESPEFWDRLYAFLK
jgi:UV excision repair protein RAD23